MCLHIRVLIALRNGTSSPRTHILRDRYTQHRRQPASLPEDQYVIIFSSVARSLSCIPQTQTASTAKCVIRCNRSILKRRTSYTTSSSISSSSLYSRRRFVARRNSSSSAKCLSSRTHPHSEIDACRVYLVENVVILLQAALESKIVRLRSERSETLKGADRAVWVNVRRPMTMSIYSLLSP